MFEIFEKNFTPDSFRAAPIPRPPLNSSHVVWQFLHKFGGMSFDGGIYRVIRQDQVKDWNNRVLNAFPNLDIDLTCFAYTWDGAVFGVNHKGKKGILYFDISSGETMEIYIDMIQFHDSDLVNNKKRILSTDIYDLWINEGGLAPKYSQCVAFKMPLFLGGDEEPSNMEISDLEVYWHITGQVLLSVDPSE